MKLVSNILILIYSCPFDSCYCCSVFKSQNISFLLHVFNSCFGGFLCSDSYLFSILCKKKYWRGNWLNFLYFTIVWYHVNPISLSYRVISSYLLLKWKKKKTISLMMCHNAGSECSFSSYSHAEVGPQWYSYKVSCGELVSVYNNCCWLASLLAAVWLLL